MLFNAGFGFPRWWWLCNDFVCVFPRAHVDCCGAFHASPQPLARNTFEAGAPCSLVCLELCDLCGLSVDLDTIDLCFMLRGGVKFRFPWDVVSDIKMVPVGILLYCVCKEHFENVCREESLWKR